MTETRFETLLYEKTGPIATLTLNRPERMNGMTNRMVIEARGALTAAAALGRREQARAVPAVDAFG